VTRSGGTALSTARPFPGLRPYAFEDYPFFFGRTDQIYSLYRLLDRARFIAVVGNSGSGKSSLVQAGLLPLIKEESEESGARSWQWTEMRPGNAPLTQLTNSLMKLSQSDEDPVVSADRRERIAFALGLSSFGLTDALGEIESLRNKSILLVVDQFEELFRYVGTSDSREQARWREEVTKFVQLLLEIGRSRSCPIHIVITMRSDFIGDCGRFHGLPEAVSATQFLVPSLTRDQCEEVIRRPIESAGGTIEPALVERLLNDGRGELDQLPVLQHCLMRLWERAGRERTGASDRAGAGGRRSRHLTLHDYRAIGTINRALSMHADEILEDLPSLHLAVEQAFRALSEVDTEGRAARRPLAFSRLLAEAGVPEQDLRSVLNRFRADDCSFLVPAPSSVPEIQSDTRIDVGHEALLRHWERVSAEPVTTPELLADASRAGWLQAEESDGQHYRGLLALVGPERGVSRTTLPLDQVDRLFSWWRSRPRTAAWAERYGGNFERVERLFRTSLRALQAARRGQEIIRTDEQFRRLREKHALPNARTLTVIAQDPSVRVGKNILFTELTVPAEDLLPGPCGYRVHVIDYDSSTNTLYEPAVYEAPKDGKYKDPFAFAQGQNGSAKGANSHAQKLVNDPRFHAQNVYAIATRTLAQFEFALGRRVRWGSDGHQIHIAPHAFADANAFYSRDDRAIFFGYFKGASGATIYTCLSHDVVAHETTHAILDGLRRRYLEPSTPDQAAFHEGFADIVGLLSVFSLPDVVGALLDPKANGNAKLVAKNRLTREALANSVLLGLADEMGSELSHIRGDALRRSVELEPGKNYMDMPEYQEAHARGELIVAAMMSAFLDIWLQRIARIGTVARGMMDRSIVVEEGARVAGHLLTMAIRAIDYCPPTDIWFSDYLAALLTVDREVVPDQGKYNYRKALLDNFQAYGIKQSHGTSPDGTWKLFDQELTYGRSHFESMLRDREELFRFIWENRGALRVREDGYVEVQSVLPSIRIGPDGFALRETVAEYIQILTLWTGELKTVLGIEPPDDIPKDRRIRILGGGVLIFDEYGRLKYHIPDRIEDLEWYRQIRRLEWLAAVGFFDEPAAARPPSGSQSHFAILHRARAVR
jgi:hypothetical protein